MIRLRNTKIVRPNILILEGLWGDTGDVIRAAGGNPDEESPWTFEQVEKEMRLGHYDGLVLTGGSDVCPSLYEEKPGPMTQTPDHMRDYEEYTALRIAQDLGMPVLGICRGSQIMNVFRGGSLVQDIDGHRNSEHTVYADMNAKTFKRAINSRQMQCISLHHQCMKTVGPDMRIAAWAGDGTPEAIESTDGKWLGVQFHPELAAFENGNAFAIFQWLVREAAAYAGGNPPFSRFRDARADYHAQKEARKRAAEQARITKQIEEANRVDNEARKQLMPPRNSRKAGDPAVPSMRDMVTIVETSMQRAAKKELQTCDRCGMLFDAVEDRIDHEIYVCHCATAEAWACDAAVMEYDNGARFIESNPYVDSDGYEVH